jgi:hypothetical protein
VGYSAERTDLAEARAPLIKLWTENLPVGVDPDEKLGWFYRDSPSGPGEAFLLRADDRSAVGCAGYVARELAFGGSTVRAALLADFAIDRGHRSALPAIVLQRAVKKYVDTAGYGLSYGFPNANAVAVHKRTGYRELGKMARFIRVLRYGGYLKRRYGWERRSAIGGALLDRAVVAASTLRALPGRRGHALVWEREFDARWDALWERPNALGHRIACRRDAALLRWRFSRQPGTGVAIAALVERGAGDRLAAYAVVKTGEAVDGAPPIAMLVDLYGVDIAALDALLGQLVPALYARGFGAIEFRYLGHPRMRDLLVRHWFSFRNTDRTVILSPTPDCPIDGALLCDSNAWFMTDLDEDT